MNDITKTTGAKLAAKQRRAEHWEKYQQVMDLWDFVEYEDFES